MALIHDLVEIDAGDTYLYDAEGAKTKAEREMKAANRIYHLLPEDQGKELFALWKEFEERKTPEAKFAATLDRFQPILLNDVTNGKAWLNMVFRKSRLWKETFTQKKVLRKFGSICRRFLIKI